MPYAVPQRIETQRLVLRQFRDEDWRDLHRLYADEEVTRYTLGRVLTEGETWRTMATLVGHWLIRGYGPYAAEDKASGRVIGPVGFWYPNDWPAPEIKYALAREFWGRGLAGEAVRAIQRAGAEHLPDVALISFIHADNAASIRLALAVQARFEAEVDFRAGRWRIYRHPRVAA